MCEVEKIAASDVISWLYEKGVLQVPSFELPGIVNEYLKQSKSKNMGWPIWLIRAGENTVKPIDEKVAMPSVIELINGEQLGKCAVSLTPERAMILAGLINKLCPKYGIITKNVLHEFLANVIQESFEFQFKAENMYYQASTIVKVWPGRFKTIQDALPFARNPKKLANEVYGKRMGNKPGTDDGWNFRGSGFIGLTGRWVLETFAKYKAFDSAETAANYCRESDYGALDSALWFFCVLKELMDEAEMDDFIGIVKEINGGTIGLKDRIHYYELVKKYVI